ncbi:uncharacterized protein [Polyergus mexicanus]|uniref:uncharacterized protein n=1 Tax=Polyergus mexicanus TaxID=615972 RepID=UPI0038B639BB
MNDLVPICNILGVNIERNGPTGNMRLSQGRYASDLFKKFRMSDCKPITTPMDSNTKVSKEDGPKSEQEIREMEDKPPGIAHWQLAKRVLRYIKGTMDYGITYEKDNNNMCAYVDAE